MILRFLGTGTSQGVPILGCRCEVCQSADPRDHRYRTAALLSTATTRVLIDAGPDIREQLLRVSFRPLHAVLLTHIHYDHVAGLDDLRPFCYSFGTINIYADENTCDGVKRTMPYCFKDVLYPGVPHLHLHPIMPHMPFTIGDINILPVVVMHDRLPILAYRFDKLAYVTDIKTISDEDLAMLDGVETLVVSALRWTRPLHSHFLVDDAIALARVIGAKQTYLTHLTHRIGLHANAARYLPKDVHLAYDGLEINV